jgi:hypothetical protein
MWCILLCTVYGHVHFDVAISVGPWRISLHIYIIYIYIYQILSYYPHPAIYHPSSPPTPRAPHPLSPTPPQHGGFGWVGWGIGGSRGSRIILSLYIYIHVYILANGSVQIANGSVRILSFAGSIPPARKTNFASLKPRTSKRVRPHVVINRDATMPLGCICMHYQLSSRMVYWVVCLICTVECFDIVGATSSQTASNLGF